MALIDEFCRDQYQFEHERKDRLNSELSVIVTGLTLALSLIAFLISKITWPITTQMAVAAFLISPSVYFIAIVFQSLWQLFNGYTYHYVTPCPEILRYRADLRVYEEEYQKPGDSEIVFESVLTEQYATAAGINRRCNDAKSGLLLIIKKHLFLSTFPCITAALFISLAI